LSVYFFREDSRCLILRNVAFDWRSINYQSELLNPILKPELLDIILDVIEDLQVLLNASLGTAYLVHQKFETHWHKYEEYIVSSELGEIRAII